MKVPNILDNDVPTGRNEEDNQELTTHGPKKKSKTAKSHQEIMEIIEGADLKRAANILSLIHI